jgi:ABC-type transport system involved in multi-copper enzyme maturation permease subunit
VINRLKVVLQNISLFLITIFVFVLFLEFVVFRFVASDIPTNAFANGIVKYAPNQEGIYKIKNEISAHYKINDQGYNSPIQNFNK